MTILPVVAKLVCADGRTDSRDEDKPKKTKLIHAFCNFPKPPENKKIQAIIFVMQLS